MDMVRTSINPKSPKLEVLYLIFLCFALDKGGAFDSKYRKLSSWLFVTHQHENWKPKPKETKVALGPNGSFWAFSNTGYRWSALPETLEDKLQEKLVPGGWFKKPIYAALGVEGSWVLVYESGKPSWDLARQYNGLHSLLESCTKKVIVSLPLLAVIDFNVTKQRHNTDHSPQFSTSP